MLSTNDLGSSGGFSGIELEKGVWVEATKIASISNKSGKTLDNLNQKFDLAIEVKMKEEGLSFQPSVTIFGDFKRDNNNKITGWGSAFKVGKFFKDVLGIDDTLTSDYNIPKTWLSSAKPTSIAKLTYAAGHKSDDPTKIRFITWDFFAPMDSDDYDQLEKAAEFLKELWDSQRDKGYPKNFDPSMLGGGSPSTPKQSNQLDSEQASMGSVSTQGETVPSEEFDPDDDDIPF